MADDEMNHRVREPKNIGIEIAHENGDFFSTTITMVVHVLHKGFLSAKSSPVGFFRWTGISTTTPSELRSSAEAARLVTERPKR